MSTTVVDQEFEDAPRRETGAPLARRLQMLAEECRRTAPAHADAWDRLRRRLGGVARRAPRRGDLLPPFALADECGRLVRLDELTRDGPLAIAFHPGHWSTFSRAYNVALSEAAGPAAAAIGARIVAITPDRQRFAVRLRDEAGGMVTVLTDPHNGYALMLGIAVWTGLELQRSLAERGTDLPSFHGDSAWIIPLPATFVVTPGGRIVDRHVSPDFRARMPIGRLLRALTAAAPAFAA